MKGLFTLVFIFLLSTICLAQNEKYFENGKLKSNIPTEELSKLMNEKYEAGEFREVLQISDTLLKREPFNNDFLEIKIYTEANLSLHNEAIADAKRVRSNKNAAADFIALIPSELSMPPGEIAEIYYKAAIEYAPEAGLAYIFYADDLISIEQPQLSKAKEYAKKGWNLLSEKRKEMLIPIYCDVLFQTGEKPTAYQLMGNHLENNSAYDISQIELYFSWFRKDNRLKDAVVEATKLINKTENIAYYKQRCFLYFDLGERDKACSDALKIQEDDFSNEYLVYAHCSGYVYDEPANKKYTYHYRLEFYGEEYDFYVSDALVDMNKELSFHFKMTDDEETEGNLKITKEALTNAYEQQNGFESGNMTLTDKTSVWVSKKVFNELKEKGEAVMKVDPTKEATTFKIIPAFDIYGNFFATKVNGQELYIPCISAESTDGTQTIWITDNPENPMILKMSILFNIELVNIETND